MAKAAETESDEVRERIRQNFLALIEEAGSPEKFAARIGVSFWTVQDWLRADRRSIPAIETLLRIAEEFDLTLDQLIKEDLD